MNHDVAFSDGRFRQHH